MDEYAIQIAGLPARAGVNSNDFFVTVTFQNVVIDGSPLIVHLDPPVATIAQVSAPTLLALIVALGNGAVVLPFGN